MFHRITIDGNEFMSIEPKAPYAPLFASIVTSEELGYWEPNSIQSPQQLNYFEAKLVKTERCCLVDGRLTPLKLDRTSLHR